jgi:hypothetical protein
MRLRPRSDCVCVRITDVTWVFLDNGIVDTNLLRSAEDIDTFRNMHKGCHPSSMFDAGFSSKASKGAQNRCCHHLICRGMRRWRQLRFLANQRRAVHDLCLACQAKRMHVGCAFPTKGSLHGICNVPTTKAGYKDKGVLLQTKQKRQREKKRKKRRLVTEPDDKTTRRKKKAKERQ